MKSKNTIYCTVISSYVINRPCVWHCLAKSAGELKTCVISYCVLHLLHSPHFGVMLANKGRENGKLCFLGQENVSNGFLLIPETESVKRRKILTHEFMRYMCVCGFDHCVSHHSLTRLSSCVWRSWWSEQIAGKSFQSFISCSSAPTVCSL